MEADRWRQHSGKAMQQQRRCAGFADRICAPTRVVPLVPKSLLGGDQPPRERLLGEVSSADSQEDMDGVGSQPLEDLILDHSEWLDCSLDCELNLEVEAVTAQFSVCGGFADIVEAASVLEELWDLTEPSSSVDQKARLVLAARSKRALKQSSSQGEVPLVGSGGVLVCVTAEPHDLWPGGAGFLAADQGSSEGCSA